MFDSGFGSGDKGFAISAMSALQRVDGLRLTGLSTSILEVPKVQLPQMELNSIEKMCPPQIHEAHMCWDFLLFRLFQSLNLRTEELTASDNSDPLKPLAEIVKFFFGVRVGQFKRSLLAKDMAEVFDAPWPNKMSKPKDLLDNGVVCDCPRGFIFQILNLGDGYRWLQVLLSLVMARDD